MARIYLTDTKNQALTLCDWMAEGLGVGKWFVPLQVPNNSPATQYRNLWVVKVPLRPSGKRWKKVKDKVMSHPLYDPARLISVTKAQFDNAMVRNNVV